MSVDFGRQFEIDRRTGNVLLNRDGKANVLEGNPLFDQAMFILLHTQRGEDMLDLNMGFDRLGIIQNVLGQDVILLTELKLKESINSTVDSRIHSLTELAISLNNRALVANFIVTNINAQSNLLKVGVQT